jgi:hypothetical protein
MDLGIAHGTYTSNTNGTINGVNNGVIHGTANGVRNEASQYGIVRDGLVFYVDAGIRSSYIGSGLTWNDLTTNAINGTLLASTMNYNSLNGGNIQFNGTNDNYITCPINSALNFCSSTSDLPFSSNVWCNVFGSSNIFYILNKGDNGAGALESYGIAIATDLTYTVSLYDTSGAFRTTATTVDPIPTRLTRRWVNISHTYSGTGGNAGLKLYINGIQQRVTLSSTGGYVRMRPQNTNLWLGSFGSTGSFRAVRSHGAYSIFQLYNKELTPAEILQNYNAQKKRFNL